MSQTNDVMADERKPAVPAKAAPAREERRKDIEERRKIRVDRRDPAWAYRPNP